VVAPPTGRRRHDRVVVPAPAEILRRLGVVNASIVSASASAPPVYAMPPSIVPVVSANSF
jgi:hypothetical protein